MPSRRENIIATLVSRLTGQVGATVYRSRLTAITREESPALVVRPEKEQVEKRNNDLSERVLIVRLEVITRGTSPDNLADTVLVAAHAKIMGDPNLGGLCLRITELGTEWLMEGADLDAGLTSIAYAIYYRTTANTLN